MILITKVEMLETDLDVAEVMKLAHTPSWDYMPFGKDVVKAEYIREIIHGRRFVHPSRGIDVVMGVTSEAGERLGLIYQTWNDVVNESIRRHDVNISLAKQLDKIHNYGFWKRLKFLFTGLRGTDEGKV